VIAETAIEITTLVNGVPHTGEVDVRLTVAEFVRDELGLKGTKTSCEMEVCGVCSVLVDGQPVSACTSLAADLDGRELATIEGLADKEVLNPLQQAFVDSFATQCGFCTPGFLMMGTALLASNPDPTEREVIDYMDGNICRCTGYRPIVNAVLLAAERMKDRP
jgi:aerobic-type carbon monoxide dehydrogenase small subunit (CoxS/CutS family)